MKVTLIPNYNIDHLPEEAFIKAFSHNIKAIEQNIEDVTPEAVGASDDELGAMIFETYDKLNALVSAMWLRGDQYTIKYEVTEHRHGPPEVDIDICKELAWPRERDGQA